ncbi:MAG: MBL fold metallo-hydrolase [Chitinophagaceae bacterium]
MKTKIKEKYIDLFVVAPGVWGIRDVFVNLYAINNPAGNNWWLVDTGLRWSGSKIKRMGELLFGYGSQPAAIILTHGHFDHVGSVKKLAEEWDIPVYAHHLEIPYLTGQSAYPPADITVGGGLMSDLSFLYPKGPIDIENRVVSLPQGGEIPGLPEWQYIHTPGHAPGHISLFRESDRVLIAGDAFVTTKSESVLATIIQYKKLSGPPKYFTSDWLSAASSVEQLANLEPEIVATGHGSPMRGAGMRKSLHNLSRNFAKLAIPSTGRYIRQPALMDDSGVVHIPPKNRNASSAPTLKILGITAAILITVLLFKKSRKKRKKIKEFTRTVNNYDGNGNYRENPEPKIHHLLFRDRFNKLKYSVREKSEKATSKVKEGIGKIKEPALEMFEHLKFKGKN